MKKNLLTLSGLALTTSLSTFSFQAHADNAWGDLTGSGFSTNTSVDKITNITTSQMVAVGRTMTDLNIDFDQTVNVNTLTTDAVFVASQINDDNLQTFIDGALNSNGKIIIQDTNGILYGSNSRIDVNGLVSTTAGTVNVSADGKSVELDDFSGNGEIVIEQGSMISIKQGGLAAFVAPTVINNGVITARAAKVELAGANTTTTVDLYGDGLLEIAVNDENSSRLLSENNGDILNDGGIVHMTTGAAKEIVDSVVNMNGVVAASSVTQVGGKIVLGGAHAGTVKVAGKVNASGKKGGGAVIAAAKSVDVTKTATVDADATETGDGGTVKILGDKYAALSGDISAKGGSQNGDGGFVELSSNENFLIGGAVDTTAANGETGTFLIDPRDVDIRLGVRNIFSDFNYSNRVYESDIEFLSLATNIDILARRNITVNANTFGSSDGIVNVNGGNDLTIRTTNAPHSYTDYTDFDFSTFSFRTVTEANNAGVIDLTGNATYGANLEFRATGNGDINILGATDGNQASNITVSKLTTQNGNINVDTKNGSIVWMGDVTTQGGDVNGKATKGITVASALLTQTGDVVLDTKGTTWLEQLKVLVTGKVQSDQGNVSLSSMRGGNIIAGEISAAQGTASLKGQQVQLVGNSKLDANIVSLDTGRVVQNATGIIIANNLTGTIQSDAVFNGTGNQIKSLDNFATGAGNWHKGGFTLKNTGDLAVSGVVSSDNTGANGTGNIDITTTGGDLTVKSTGGVVTQNATITLASDSLIDVDMGANVAAGNGDITVNAPTVNLGADLNTTGIVAGRATTVNVENNTAQIQDGIDVAKAGNGTWVNVAAGTYAQQVTVDKALILSGAGSNKTILTPGAGKDAITIDGDIGDTGRVYIRSLVVDGGRNGVVFKDTANANELLIGGSLFKNNSGAGVRVENGNASNNVNKLNIAWSKFNNNGLNGVAVYGDTTSQASISNSTFLNNGALSTANGDGDILFYGYNGDITLNNVDIQGNTGGLADYAIQLFGGAPLSNAGTVTLDNVSIAGQYRSALLGIQRYADLSLSMNDVTLGGQTTAGNNSIATNGWSGAMFLSNVGSSDIDLGNTAFDTHDTNYIVLGVDNVAPFFTASNIDATNATFLGKTGATTTLAENFAIEDKITHALDYMPSGLVTWKADNVFVTQNSGSIQRGIDASNVGGTVNVNDGTYAENVNVNKTVSVFGNRRDATKVKIQGKGTGNGLTLAADDIDLRYMTVDGFTNGIYTDTAINNTFMRNVNSNNNANYGFEIHNNADVNGLDMRNVRISNNGSVGMRIRGAAENVRISGGVMNGNKHGLVSVSGNGENKAFNNVTITNTKFVNNLDKGIYLEKLSNATIKGIEVRKSGNNAASGNNAGIDVNLKYGAYENITFDNINVNRSGANGTGTGNAFTVKARNDGSYASNPASLTNLVVKNSTITAAGNVAVAVGNNVDGVTVENSTITGPEALLTYGGVQNVDIKNNMINSTGLSSRGGSYGIGAFGNGGTTTLTNNIIKGVNTTTGILINDTDNTSIIENEISNANSGILVSGTSDATLILGNTINNNNVGLQTLGGNVKLVQVADNQFDANAIGMLLAGGEIDISNLLAPNSITGGATSLMFEGPNVSLVNNSLGATVFTDQTGNYVTLQNGALFNPGTPTVIDGLAANYNGIIPLNSPLGAGLITGAQRTAIEGLIQDFNDDATLGDIVVGLGLDISEEDLFALGLYSFSPAAANVNVTFRGLPPVSAPSLNALANISPAAGGDDIGGGSAAELASLEPAAGGNDGCWASVGETGFDGTVNFSFGGGINSAISDSACAQ